MLFYLLLILTIHLARGLECDRLSNGCYLKKFTHDKQQEDQSYRFICKRLDQSFSLNEEISACVNGSFDVYFRLSGRKTTIFDEKFNLNTLVEIQNLRIIQFRFLKGFSINLKEMDKTRSDLSQIFIEIYYSDFFFFNSKNSPVRSCLDLGNQSVQTIFQIVHAESVRYFFLRSRFGSKEQCPLLFANSTVTKLYIFDSFVNSFLKSNILRFSTSINTSSINSNIRHLLVLKFDKIDIDERFLEKRVFEKLTICVLIGEISSIQQGLFKSFSYLRKVTLHALFYPKLVRRKGARWLNDLNSNVRVNFSDRIELETTNILERKFFIFELSTISPWRGIFYSFDSVRMPALFPDEDFCLYVDYPFEQAVFFFYDRAPTTPLRPCTYVWLIQYAQIYNEYLNYYYYFDVNLAIHLKYIVFNLSEQIQACNFEKR